jgi:hypothetical protein
MRRRLPVIHRSAGWISPGIEAFRGLRRVVLTSFLAGVLGLSGANSALDAQAPVQEPSSAAVVPPPIEISPGGAFLRSILVPGWGHAAIGSYTRGGFYFGAQATIAFTALRTNVRIGEARDRLALRESLVRARLIDEGITDPAELDERLQADAGVTELTSLVDSREQQREDLIALGIFVLLLSGADAYVSAHLSRFPEPLAVGATPTAPGVVELELRVKLPN